MVHLDPARAVGAAADLLAPPPPGPFVSHAGPDAVPPLALPRSRALGAEDDEPDLLDAYDSRVREHEDIERTGPR